MKRILFINMVILILFIGFVSLDGTRGQFGIEIDFGSIGEIGDFFEISLTSYDDEVEMEGSMRMEYTGVETISLMGKSYNCEVFDVQAKIKLKVEGEADGSMDVNGNLYYDKSTGYLLKDISNYQMNYFDSGNMVEYHEESETIYTDTFSNWTGDGDPKIGDEWTVTKVSETTTTNTWIDDESEYSETDTEYETEVVYHEYLKDETVTIGIGTFHCRVIKTYDDPGNSDLYYDLEFTESGPTNIPIKFESYEFEDLVLMMETTAYKVGDEKAGTPKFGATENEKNDEENGLFGLGKTAGIDTFILVIFAIVIVVILAVVGISMKRNKRSGYGRSDSAVQRFSAQQTDPYWQPAAQQPVQQTSQPPQPPQFQRPVYTCHTCGGPLEYQEIYQKYYCGYCRRYQ